MKDLGINLSSFLTVAIFSLLALGCQSVKEKPNSNNIEKPEGRRGAASSEAQEATSNHTRGTGFFPRNLSECRFMNWDSIQEVDLPSIGLLPRDGIRDPGHAMVEITVPTDSPSGNEPGNEPGNVSDSRSPAKVVKFEFRVIADPEKFQLIDNGQCEGMDKNNLKKTCQLGFLFPKQFFSHEYSCRCRNFEGSWSCVENN